MRLISTICALVVALLTTACRENGSSPQPVPKPIDPSESQVSGNPTMAPVDYLGTVAKAKKSAEAKAALAQITHAIKFFEAAEGGRPKAIEDLVEKGYLNALPKPPHGMKLVYNPATGEADYVMAE